MAGMQMAAMMSKSGGGDVVSLLGGNFADVASAPDAAEAGYQLTSGGKEREGAGNPILYADINDWVVPNGSAANYEVRATLNSGTLRVGSSATGSWLALSSTRTWSVRRLAAGITNADLTIEIRPAGGGATLATANVTLEAEIL